VPGDSPKYLLVRGLCPCLCVGMVSGGFNLQKLTTFIASINGWLEQQVS